LGEAQQLALAKSHQQFSIAHVGMAIAKSENEHLIAFMRAIGADQRVFAKFFDKKLNSLPRVDGGPGQLYMQPASARLMAKVGEDAKARWTCS
jgi:ATPases with chaperone activity, ATP-binding subunit